MGDLFSPPSPPRPQPVASSAPSAKALLPGAKADAAARAGGGISPQFIQNMLSQQGANAGSLDVLQSIRESLGGSSGGAGLTNITNPDLLKRLGGQDITA